MARRGTRALALAALVLGASVALARAQHPVPHPHEDHLPNARLPRDQRSTSLAQKKVNRAYEKASEAVAMADANLVATKVKSSADVQATVAQNRAEIASAALGAATKAKVIPLVLVPGKLGQNARAEVQYAATNLVATAVDAHEDKLEALAEAAQAVGKAVEKKAAVELKADAAVDKAVQRAQKKSGHKIVQLPGAGVAGPSIVPAVAPIVTPKPALGVVGKGVGVGNNNLFGLPKLGFPTAIAAPNFGLGGLGLGLGAAAAPVKKTFGFGRRRLMQAQQQDFSQPAALNGGAALAMFANAAVAFGTQLQKLAQAAQQPQQAQYQQQQQGPVLQPEAGMVQQQLIQQQQQQQQLPYNPSALGSLAPALAGLGGAVAPMATAAPGALSPRTQAVIGAVSGAAGLALNAAAPLVRGVAAAVPVMVPTVDGGCVSGKRIRVDGQGTFCVLGNWEPAAQALMNGAGLATAAAGPAAAGVANLIASTRANGGAGNVGRGGGPSGRPLGPRDQPASPRYLD